MSLGFFESQVKSMILVDWSQIQSQIESGEVRWSHEPSCFQAFSLQSLKSQVRSLPQVDQIKSGELDKKKSHLFFFSLWGDTPPRPKKNQSLLLPAKTSFGYLSLRLTWPDSTWLGLAFGLTWPDFWVESTWVTDLTRLGNLDVSCSWRVDDFQYLPWHLVSSLVESGQRRLTQFNQVDFFLSVLRCYLFNIFLIDSIKVFF